MASPTRIGVHRISVGHRLVGTMRGARLAGVGLLMAPGIACSLAPPATAVQDRAASVPSRPEHSVERPAIPGSPFPAARLARPAVPGQAASSRRVPAGSRVEATGRAVDVGGDMRLQLWIPADARGVMPVRAIRPDRAVLVLHVEIVHD